MRRTTLPIIKAVTAVAAGLAFLAPAGASAGYYPTLYTATRANSMGGAFVAVADDEEAIFMNPAGLAGVKGVTFTYAAADVELSTDTLLAGLQGATALSNPSGNTLNAFMGKDIYSSVQFAPSLIMPNFGVSLISNGQFQLVEQNVANPNINLGYQITNGVQAAMGFSVLPKRLRSKSDLRVGVAVKMLWRQGGYHDLDFLEMLSLTQDPVDQLHAMNGPYSLGVGVDVGTQYQYTVSKNLTLGAALVMTNVGDTSFANPADQPIKSNMTAGLAATYKLRKIKAILDFDYQHILQDMDFGSKTHVGLELQVPFINLDCGLDQMNLTYGASFDIWILRISAASYAQELASYAGQNPERRYALHIALKFGI